MKNISLPAAIVFASLIVSGIVLLALKQDVLGASLITAALGQLAPSPFKDESK